MKFSMWHKLAVFLIAGIFFSLQANALSRPPVFDAEFEYWDHHWFVWLPTHPVYESVEVMEKTYEDSTESDVWVFFTERAGAKQQVHFFNKLSLIENKEGQSFYQEMEYSRSGFDGLAQSVDVRFENNVGELVEITVDSGYSPLWPGGLTNQSGHSQDLFLLIFYRGLQAFSRFNHIAINGVDYSFNDPSTVENPPFFTAAYSQNIYTGVLSYSDTFYMKWGKHLLGSNGNNFSRQRLGFGDVRYVSNSERARQEYRWDFFKLVDYKFIVGDHELRVEFGQPLNFLSRQTENTFSISLDDLGAQITGQVILERYGFSHWILSFQPNYPEWAKSQAFQVEIHRSWWGDYDISTYRLQ